jgi:hypothetical protein
MNRRTIRRRRGLNPAAGTPTCNVKGRGVAEQRSIVALAALLLCASLSSGCVSTQPPRSELYDRVGHGKLTLGALRIIMRDCARRFPAVLEAAATNIAEGPNTPAQRKGLVEFKANGVPLIQSVLLQQDPVAGLLDSWALLYQLRDYLISGTVDQARLAQTVQTVEGLASELARLWAELTGRPDVRPERGRIEAWARAHPLKGSLLARDSTAPLVANLLGSTELSVMGAAGSALASMEDAMARLDLYTVTIPRQARWQAEAAVMDFTSSPQVESTVASLNQALDRALDLTEPLSELAADTSAIISRERAAILTHMDGERLALQGFVRDERRAMVADLASERDATLRQADGIAHGIVDQVFVRLERVLLRVAVAVLGLLVVAAFLGWLLLWRGRRRLILEPSTGPRGARLTEREA